MKQDSEPISHSEIFEEQLRLLVWDQDISQRLTRLCEIANKPDACGDDAPTIQKLAKWLEQLIKDQNREKPSPIILGWLNNALRPDYNTIPARTGIDDAGLHPQLMHPQVVQPEALIAFMLGASIKPGMWRRIRRCKYDRARLHRAVVASATPSVSKMDSALR